MPLPQSDPTIYPMLYLNRGEVVRPAEGGFAAMRDEEGGAPDVFDVTDRLFEKYHRLYLIDVDGLTRNDPQLDYLQELSRGREVWAESGPRTADQVIDVIVGGATLAVLTLRVLRSPEKEVRHALTLTADIALEIETEGGKVLSEDPTINALEVGEVSRLAVEWGVKMLILPSQGSGWETVAELSKVSGVFMKGVRPEEFESLRASGAAGAIMEVDLHG